MSAASIVAGLLFLGAAPAPSGGISLAPAVVELAGEAGQSTTQRLTLRNDTSVPLSFALEARDVVVRDGRRVLLPPGEIPASVAATAVFSEPSVTVAPGSISSVTLTVTLPPGVAHRAVVALFRGTTRLGDGDAGATASLGTLLTFALSDRVALAVGALGVTPPGAAANAVFEAPVLNAGSEPVVVRGAGVVLDPSGRIAARARFDQRRVLPGERVVLRAEHAGELARGGYRVLATVEYGQRSVTRSAELAVP